MRAVQVSKAGFGDIDNFQTGASVVFRGQLYVTTRNDVTGAQPWRTSKGTTVFHGDRLIGSNGHSGVSSGR